METHHDTLAHEQHRPQRPRTPNATAASRLDEIAQGIASHRDGALTLDLLAKRMTCFVLCYGGRDCRSMLEGIVRGDERPREVVGPTDPEGGSLAKGGIEQRGRLYLAAQSCKLDDSKYDGGESYDD